jgi:hypothetical protein
MAGIFKAVAEDVRELSDIISGKGDQMKHKVSVGR